MADDGMLLNFDIGDGIIAAKSTFKGGRWKDRMSAKRSAGYRRRLENTPATGVNAARKPNRESEHSDSETGARSAKRQRLDGNIGGSNGLPSSKTNSKGPQREVISSLFTYNPKSTTTSTAQTHEEAHVEPSNAPLNSELDTFTSLGLTASLASHLLSKMNIKAPTAIQKAAITQLLKEDSDAFIQAETGSGKTLAYLLPIVQRIMKISTEMKEVDGAPKDAINRKTGLFAIILAPTRELSKQIQVVLDSLLRCAHWIVSGIVIGGENKQSEKARLRKGVNILVATPGRLADHLQHTEALDASCVRWLVLDEGDRLMELGFENDIQKIVGVLNLRLKAAADRVKLPGLPAKRTTVLCSATMKVNVQRLGEISLREAIHIQKDPGDKDADQEAAKHAKEDEFSAPAQLKQSYAIVPAKLRLVSLIAYLKRAFERRGSVMKAIVFMSCADSVDFHFNIVTQLEKAKQEHRPPEKVTKEQVLGEQKDAAGEADAAQALDSEKTTEKTPKHNPFAKFVQGKTVDLTITHALSTLVSSQDNPVTAYRLHGSLPQALRTSTISRFSKSSTASVLIATDVASRGLDVPNVDLVLEYDPAFARDDHLHRIGRTARAGRDGRACVFLMPGCEEKYVETLVRDRRDTDGASHLLRQTSEDILKRAFTPNKPQTKVKGQLEAWDARATELQLKIERWILDAGDERRLEGAKRAFQGHVRAYATHVAAERDCFDIKELHLGHLAKAFALRDKPSGLGALERRVGAGSAAGKKGNRAGSRAGDESRTKADKGDEAEQAARKMREKIKMQKMMGTGADEFNLG
ncbi:ATP dependent RNA helicase [Pseudovirgaria hyperparasitica]|uniref:ATP-dependent RNA helicase n=1 Tax=Pseudovirgaria hyperparasitica TaxID=470096 RepID=A0A6A6VYL9_9PEZI|nr:ATP dependent RNA helicase [Pseudovirgaria hyperparasitica]KAF2755315.1 ATP dependent RNA helicase [Pseudovirgaria hyperparasitica]